MKHLWSYDYRRGRISYLLMSLAALVIWMVWSLFGLYLFGLETADYSILAVGVILASTMITMVAGGFLAAQRVRDMGWSVPLTLITFYGLAFASGLTVEFPQISMLLCILQVILALFIMFTPGKEI